VALGTLLKVMTPFTVSFRSAQVVLKSTRLGFKDISTNNFQKLKASSIPQMSESQNLSTFCRFFLFSAFLESNLKVSPRFFSFWNFMQNDGKKNYKKSNFELIFKHLNVRQVEDNAYH
jgi:hypothetical protein